MRKISMASSTRLWMETPAALSMKHPAMYAHMLYVVARRWRMQYVTTQGSLMFHGSLGSNDEASYQKADEEC